MIQSRKLLILIGFFTLLTISACGDNSNATPTAVLRGAIVPTRIPTDIPTATSTSTPTMTPTNTPTATDTATPTFTASPTDTPTATYTPTIDQTQVASNIDEGDTLLDLQNLFGAISRYTDAIELDPNTIDAYQGRGLAYYRNEQFEEALADFTTAIDLDPTLIDAYFNRALVQIELFDLEAAAEDMKTVTELDPSDTEAHYELGLMLADLDDIDGGLESFATALELDPTYPDVYAARGMLHYLNGDYDLALPDLESYVLYAGDDATQDILNLLEETRSEVATPQPPTQPATAEPPPPTLEVIQQSEPQAIDFDEQFDGTITIEIYEYLYEFTASAGERVDIKMTARAGTLDPLILLMDSDGTIIAENDDDLNNTGRDSFLQGFEIPEDGMYTIVATRFQQELGNTVGSFTVSLALSPDDGRTPPPTPSSGDSDLLQFGDVVSGEITDDSFAIAYKFMARQGDVVDIQLVATNDDSTLDPLLILLNPDGDNLVENDDDPDGVGRDSYIHAFEIPIDGEYTIVATRFQQELGTTTGEFEVTLTISDSPPASEATQLEYGDEYDGEITTNIMSETLEFDAEAGDIVDISMQATTGTLDPLLILLDDDGDEIIRNDDDEQGVGSNSYIRGFVIPADGTYTIVATHFQEEQGTTTGRYTLTLEKIVSEA